MTSDKPESRVNLLNYLHDIRLYLSRNVTNVMMWSLWTLKCTSRDISMHLEQVDFPMTIVISVLWYLVYSLDNHVAIHHIKVILFVFIYNWKALVQYLIPGLI